MLACVISRNRKPPRTSSGLFRRLAGLIGCFERFLNLPDSHFVKVESVAVLGGQRIEAEDGAGDVLEFFFGCLGGHIGVLMAPAGAGVVSWPGQMQ